jgi:heme/copper-type cytochrome/quinol oxidase subunit 1
MKPLPYTSSQKLSEKLGNLACWFMFVGFHVTFFPMHLTGLRSMPRRVFTYPADTGIGGITFGLQSLSPQSEDPVEAKHL